jgi:hypothetical protein
MARVKSPYRVRADAMQGHALRLGEFKVVKRGFMKSWALGYAGIPNDRVYSLFIRWTDGYMAAAYNLFVPLDRRELELLDGLVTVTHLSEMELRFRYDRR